jgi:hypothetical protein
VPLVPAGSPTPPFRSRSPSLRRDVRLWIQRCIPCALRYPIASAHDTNEHHPGRAFRGEDASQLRRRTGHHRRRPERPLRTPIFGTPGNDVIVGTEENDQIFGPRGTGKDDLLVGDSKDNILVGGGGNDALFGRGGRDILRG